MQNNPLVVTGVFKLGPVNPVSGLRPLIDLSDLALPANAPIGHAAEWPRHLETRRRKSGELAYYWKVPTRDRDKGCFIPAEPLGTDFECARQRADDLNGLLDRWRADRKALRA